MDVKGVGYNDNRVKMNAKSALAAGAVCAGVKALFLPLEERLCFKLALTSKDSYMRGLANELKNPEIASQYAEMMKQPEFAAHCAKQGIKDAKGLCENVFDTMKAGAKEVSKQTLKNLGKTFVFIAGAVFIGNAVADFIATRKNKAANKTEKAN